MLFHSNTGKTQHKDFTVALAGNPNVGKSSVFNELTKLNQHTGNWAGKTVEICKGTYEHNKRIYEIIDLPGSYSLFHNSEEEQITDEFILNNSYDCIVIIVDSTSLERNLLLVIQILSRTSNAILCLNMNDEAEKKDIFIDQDELSLQLGIPVIKTSSKKKHTIEKLKHKIESLVLKSETTFTQNRFTDTIKIKEQEKQANLISRISSDICNQTVKRRGTSYSQKDKRLDYLFTSKFTGTPIMILLFGLIFWITAIGANYPSRLLSNILFGLKDYLSGLFYITNTPEYISGFLLDGVYTSVCWVLSVMLPPALIFFPMFSIIEDFGYFPRVVFNLDRYFRKSGTTGKQALTMALGFGCNACGVTGCRIMSTRKEKILSVITNVFIPCNGRLPTLIAIISIFFTARFSGVLGSVVTAGMLLCIILLCVVATIIVTRILNRFIKTDKSASLALELPPFRRPQFTKCIIYSIKEKVLYVTSRAILVSAPCGGLLWLLGNLRIKDTTLLKAATGVTDEFASLFGIDGVILIAFILSFPANELLFPTILMVYMSQNTLTDYASFADLSVILTNNGWTVITAVCVLILCIFHYPCSTTCFVIKKETQSIKVLLSSILIPTFLGLLITFTVNTIYKLII